ncbi:hypothetical protein FBEOM_4399 [Fusarium beomiforme]|uniref:Uncharacterized protein n=1 Tax=Fusarium beomiforme TaxID=44412 RepID=A0A9P5AMV8_9HYPO|nr:hypothetical protein FBEOM_4399 [Fusarium beomiforme]
MGCCESKEKMPKMAPGAEKIEYWPHKDWDRRELAWSDNTRDKVRKRERESLAKNPRSTITGKTTTFGDLMLGWGSRSSYAQTPVPGLPPYTPTTIA